MSCSNGSFLECLPSTVEARPGSIPGLDMSSLGLRWPWSSLFIIHWKKGTLMVPYFQRVLNDLWRTRLVCEHMILLLTYPLSPLSSDQVVTLSQSSCVSPVELTDKGWGWARSLIRRPQESLVMLSINHSILCASFLLRNGLQPPPPLPLSYPLSLSISSLHYGLKLADRGEGREPKALKRKWTQGFSLFILILRILLVVGACAKLAALTVAINKSSVRLCPAHLIFGIHIWICGNLWRIWIISCFWQVSE